MVPIRSLLLNFAYSRLFNYYSVAAANCICHTNITVGKFVNRAQHIQLTPNEHVIIRVLI